MKAEWSNKDSLEMPTTTTSDYIKKEDAAERVAFELMYEAAIAQGLSYKELFDLEKEKIDRIKLHILQKWLEQVPSANVVEVVRCKDCKKRNTRTCMMNNNVGMNKDLFDDDYCSYGEKKDE